MYLQLCWWPLLATDPTVKKLTPTVQIQEEQLQATMGQATSGYCYYIGSSNFQLSVKNTNIKQQNLLNTI